MVVGSYLKPSRRRSSLKHRIKPGLIYLIGLVAMVAGANLMVNQMGFTLVMSGAVICALGVFAMIRVNQWLRVLNENSIHLSPGGSCTIDARQREAGFSRFETSLEPGQTY